jgi:hypothetical protein
MAACLTSARRTQIQDRITRIEARIALYDNALEGLLSADGVESFKFDSGEAMSWAKYYTPDKIFDLIIADEKRLDWYQRKLNGTGITSLNLRRKGYNLYCGGCR